MSIRIQREKLRLIQEANRRLDEQDRVDDVTSSDREYGISKRGEDLKYSKGSESNETPCDHIEDCDFDNTGMYWDEEQCECVPLIV